MASHKGVEIIINKLKARVDPEKEIVKKYLDKIPVNLSDLTSQANEYGYQYLKVSIPLLNGFKDIAFIAQFIKHNYLKPNYNIITFTPKENCIGICDRDFYNQLYERIRYEDLGNQVINIENIHMNELLDYYIKPLEIEIEIKDVINIILQYLFNVNVDSVK